MMFEPGQPVCLLADVDKDPEKVKKLEVEINIAWTKAWDLN